METYKEKIKDKLDEFKEKQNLKLEKFKLKTKNNKKKSKRKYKGGNLKSDETKALTIFITSISNKNLSEINLDDIKNNDNLKQIFTPDYFIQEFDHIYSIASMMETKNSENRYQILEKLVTLVIRINLINDSDIIDKLNSLIQDRDEDRDEGEN